MVVGLAVVIYRFINVRLEVMNLRRQAVSEPIAPPDFSRSMTDKSSYCPKQNPVITLVII